MTINVEQQRALMNVRAIQSYVQSVSSMPSMLVDGLLEDLEFIAGEIEYYNGDVKPKPEREPCKSTVLFDFWEKYANDQDRFDCTTRDLGDINLPTMENDDA